MNMIPTQEFVENVTYDELTIGRSARLLRTLSVADIQAFAAVSGDTNPVHLDAEYANDTLFHGVIAHGMWGGALISALLGTRFPGAGTIYLEQVLHFVKPVRVGDTLAVTVTVLPEPMTARSRLTGTKPHDQLAPTFQLPVAGFQVQVAADADMAVPNIIPPTNNCATNCATAVLRNIGLRWRADMV